MGHDALPREYRMKRNRMLLFLFVIAAGTVSVVGAVMSADGLGAFLTYAFLIAWVALMGWLFYATLRCSTVADIKAIHARGVFRRRRLAWEDIQDIKVEFSYEGAVQSGAAGVLVHAYGRDGSKVLLPFLDDVHVDVERELGVLLEAWQELRGEDWTPNPEAAVAIHRHEARQKAISTGLTAVGCAFLPLMVLAGLPLFMAWPDWLEAMLSPLWVMLLGAFLVFTLTAVLSYRRRVRGD
ncbi:PH domain-containing protein [Streptomyces spongiae]|uniref:PH domain-containing protein n=1 Tax=Streptomyces spongiae TaxID=565072 RepID=A0A5N8XTI4_9ACTN|nr:PH domain-containing protein [Streptomyces spongiae]MPY61935.1 PH domain-containing protein [Streptomyces spongiae]